MSPQSKFWDWFAQHQELFRVEGDQDQLFDQLAVKIQEYDTDLTFELGPKGLQRKLVISAGGIRQAFSFVVSLVNAAPAFANWQIIAFRPRRIFFGTLEFQGKKVNFSDVQFSLLDNGMSAGIYLFIPDFKKRDVALMQIGYLILDDMPGEYDVETKVGLIKILSPEMQTVGDRYPIAELPSCLIN